jgi:hypothetical protein
MMLPAPAPEAARTLEAQRPHDLSTQILAVESLVAVLDAPNTFR